MANGEGVAASGNFCRRIGVVTPERWKQIEAVFEQTLELSPEQRQTFLKNSCNDDDELRREVESLLESHSKAGKFIDQRSVFFPSEVLEEIGPTLAADQLIGPYRIVHEIGRGGMGAVYLAERADSQYKKQVAIKLIKRGMDSDSVLRHFQNERQTLANFDHPNIARLFDAGTTESGQPFFVMEYIEGLSIEEYCDEHQLAVPERLKLFREVCAAVSYAHRRLVVHRDIKRSNILVTAEGAPKLLDFGIAKILQQGEGRESFVTMTGARLMTPECASPEQLRGEPVTTATDVYSLGVVLYELLTGQPPYKIDNHIPLEVARIVAEEEPVRPSTAVARHDGNPKIQIRNPKLLRGDLDNIVLMALRKEPERRYQSVDQFSEDIRRHLEARPIVARKDSLGYRAAKFVERNKAATAAATLVLLSLLGGIIATTWQASRANAEKARAERRFNDLHQLAHSVLFDYHDAIKDLPGATHARERLVKDALVYLDKLANEAAGDPALQRELASAYQRVGDVRGEAFSASLGDRQGALESYFKALRIREALVAAAPMDLQNRRDLASIYQKVGNELLETSDAPRGLEFLQKALTLFSSLAQEQPHRTELQSDLASIHNDVGMAREGRGDMAGALEHHSKAMELRERLLKAYPNNSEARRNLSVTQVNTARALYFKGDVPAAIERNRKAIELTAALVAENPTNALYRRLLAIGYQNDGDYHAQINDIAAALQSFRKKIALDEQALAADSDNVQAQGDYAYSAERIGVFLSEQGNFKDALSYFRDSATYREKRAARDPQDLAARYGLVISLGELALTEAKLGNAPAAIEYADNARTQLEKTAIDPSDMYLRGVEAQAYGWLGRAHSELARDPNLKPPKQHWRIAREMFKRSLDIWQDLRARGTLASDDAPKLDETARAIGKCDAALATNK